MVEYRRPADDGAVYARRPLSGAVTQGGPEITWYGTEEVTAEVGPHPARIPGTGLSTGWIPPPVLSGFAEALNSDLHDHCLRRGLAKLSIRNRGSSFNLPPLRNDPKVSLQMAWRVVLSPTRRTIDACQPTGIRQAGGRWTLVWLDGFCKKIRRGIDRPGRPKSPHAPIPPFPNITSPSAPSIAEARSVGSGLLRLGCRGRHSAGNLRRRNAHAARPAQVLRALSADRTLEDALPWHALAWPRPFVFPRLAGAAGSASRLADESLPLPHPPQ